MIIRKCVLLMVPIHHQSPRMKRSPKLPIRLHLELYHQRLLPRLPLKYCLHNQQVLHPYCLSRVCLYATSHCQRSCQLSYLSLLFCLFVSIDVSSFLALVNLYLRIHRRQLYQELELSPSFASSAVLEAAVGQFTRLGPFS